MFEQKSRTPLLLSIDKIWDRAPHSALTDLIKWREKWWCIFREADEHYGGRNGILRLLQSDNGIVYQLVATIEMEGWDLRDPKLSAMPDGTLMLLAGASQFGEKRRRLKHLSVVAFSKDGLQWSEPEKVMEEEWLWRITWFKGIGYAVSYFFSDPLDIHSEWMTRLYKTSDGRNYEVVTGFSIPGKPNETTLRFFPSGQMVALLRRNDNFAWIGTSFPPYEDWLWAETHCSFEGPNFLILPDNTMWAAGRIVAKTPYTRQERTVVASMSLNTIDPKIVFPSGGDCSYPGMVYEEPYLWVSYYSSHESNTAVYLAKILLD